ncbi:MAG: hypothetical protein ACRDZ3_18365 [Acidimicrobiia bacterium]
MDLNVLARTVDEQGHGPGADGLPACLFGVRLTGGAGGPVVLEELARGEARELPEGVKPPAGLAAIALTTTAWAAPLDGIRPGRHPQRRPVRLTVVIAGDGEDVSVLTEPGVPAQVLRDGVGLVHRRMVRCWARRPEGPCAPRILR